METREEWIEKVKKDWSVLIDAPDSIKADEEICLEAVRQNGYVLRYVPEGKRTEVLYSAGVQRGYRLEDVPEGKRTEAVYLAAVQRGYALDDVPEDKRTEAICLEAVKKDGCALAYVPTELQTEEICLEAARQLEFALEDVPEDKRTEAICLEVKRRESSRLAEILAEGLPLIESKESEVTPKVAKLSPELREHKPKLSPESREVFCGAKTKATTLDPEDSESARKHDDVMEVFCRPKTKATTLEPELREHKPKLSPELRGVFCGVSSKEIALATKEHVGTRMLGKIKEWFSRIIRRKTGTKGEGAGVGEDAIDR